MQNYITLSVKGTEYKLKATTQAKIEAENQLGFSLGEALEKSYLYKVISVVLWASLQALNHGIALKDVYTMIDDMEADGFTLDGKEYDGFGLEEKGLLVYEILKVSGFFTKAQIAEFDLGLQEQIDNQTKTKAKPNKES